MLASTRGEQLRGKVKISTDTVLRVAQMDAQCADRLTGRGVTTSHASVARQLGMSDRTVGTARRLLEKLGVAVTVVLGRHLSPAERRQAKRAHGGYQEAAASVRAMTIPESSRSVESFHLPRSGSVLEEPQDQKWSPTRARARETAATRPKLRRMSRSRPQPPKSPRPIALQEFAWRIARNYGLHSPEPATTPGALYGGRHIGQLCNILERHQITPDRYTLETLRVELDDALSAARIRPLDNADKRDRLAHFAWMLGKLQAFTRGETRRERQLREQEERVKARALAADEARARAAEEAAALKDAEAARAAFFADHHRSPVRPRNTSPSSRTAAIKALVTALIGPSPLHQQSRTLQQLVGDITVLERVLVDSGWIPAHEPAEHRARWELGDHALTIELQGDEAAVVLPRDVLPAPVAEQLHMITSRQSRE
ncbi:hypothetical protein [Microbacterium flavum]|uniref:hypothetical protein n=1 Tax=Microbacterium flavum TaxID=415216 RepID=UPI0024AC9858|nr:hypothetical protein [Microbacterium flavum]